MSAGRPFVFLDKDGTLVEDVPYNVDPAQIRLARGVVEGLRDLRRAGYGLAVVSNQSGVARGLCTEAQVEAAARALSSTLAEGGTPLDGFYFCPHHPDGIRSEYAIECDCRKPSPGLVRRAAAELGADLTESWLVGDILDDVEAGRRAGCRTVMIDAGHETLWHMPPLRRPEAFVPDFRAAADYIVGHAAPRPHPRGYDRSGHQPGDPSGLSGVLSLEVGR